MFGEYYNHCNVAEAGIEEKGTNTVFREMVLWLGVISSILYPALNFVVRHLDLYQYLKL